MAVTPRQLAPHATSHRAWIEVDHAAIAHNLRLVRELGREGQLVIGVVKANAYGHGDAAVARTLQNAGAESLAVATVAEGQRLRAAGVSLPLLVLFEMTEREAGAAVAADLQATVFTARGIAALDAAASAVGRRVAVHLKVDTGLGRQGVDPAGAAEMGRRIAASRALRLAGTYTHLAAPGEDDAFTDVQVVRLARALDAMRSEGVDPGLVHVSGTDGLLAGAAAFADALRPGLALYGMVPGWASDRDPGFRPALSVRALPLRVYELAAGAAIGYGLRFRARRPSRIATLPIGYGDGWPRVHTNNGTVLVRGRRAPMVGTVAMDALCVDVTDVEGVDLDDEFVLIGGQDGERITADEVAAQRRTINYEVTTGLRDRLPRVAVGT